MINAEDLAGNRHHSTSSHVTFFFIKRRIRRAFEFKRWIKPAVDPSQRIMDMHEDARKWARHKPSERYLGLSTISLF